jgi:hypothetical protein
MSAVVIFHRDGCIQLNERILHPWTPFINDSGTKNTFLEKFFLFLKNRKNLKYLAHMIFLLVGEDVSNSIDAYLQNLCSGPFEAHHYYWFFYRNLSPDDPNYIKIYDKILSSTDGFIKQEQLSNFNIFTNSKEPQQTKKSNPKTKTTKTTTVNHIPVSPSEDYSIESDQVYDIEEESDKNDDTIERLIAITE